MRSTAGNWKRCGTCWRSTGTAASWHSHNVTWRETIIVCCGVQCMFFMILCSWTVLIINRQCCYLLLMCIWSKVEHRSLEHRDGWIRCLVSLSECIWISGRIWLQVNRIILWFLIDAVVQSEVMINWNESQHHRYHWTVYRSALLPCSNHFTANHSKQCAGNISETMG